MNSLTNNRPSSIYRLRPFSPPLSSSDPSLLTATLGLQIRPLPELEALQAELKGKSPEVLGAGSGSGIQGGGETNSGAMVQVRQTMRDRNVGYVAEKVVKNVCMRSGVFSHQYSTIQS